MSTIIETDPLPTFDEIYENAKQTFRKTFKTEANVGACAPGRVNLIGEHIDYNDGFVLPMALPMVTMIVGRRNGTESTVNILTCCDEADSPTQISIDLKSLTVGTPKWANYVKGVLKYYGVIIPGFDAVIVTNVPIGSGLSSSAALEVATITFAQALIKNENVTSYRILTKEEQALLCQRAEHQFVGMPCGIMDQLISVMGKRDHAMLIDCQSLYTTLIPFKTDENLALLICNSNVRHELSHSEYPIRREQCARALELMKLGSYRNATMKCLDALKGFDEVLVKRARHVITEIHRTQEAADALKRCDFIKVGQLMNESHKSLRDDFEVSCDELDLLVEAAVSYSTGVYGSRMTGAGFGGCTITLLKKTEVNNVIKHIKSIYEKYGRTASFYVCQPEDGARVIL